MRSLPKIITSTAEIQEWRRKVSGSNGRVNGPTLGFVPTMGALHRGHGMLLRAIRPRCDISVLSIFVNPTQFAPHEDLDRYPRSFESDLAMATAEGVDVVFAPTAQDLYPQGFSTFVEETQLSRPFCGRFRPGHFRGVTTIVLKLFNLLRPDLALFGLKDAQQFFVLKQMVQDLNLDVEIEGVETVRELDGLALSSRNVYLSSQDRERAPLLYKTLQQIKADVRDSDLGAKSISAVLAESLKTGEKTLIQNGFSVQYLECRKLPGFDVVNELSVPHHSYLVAAAALLGKTRLIDNIILS